MWDCFFFFFFFGYFLLFLFFFYKRGQILCFHSDVEIAHKKRSDSGFSDPLSPRKLWSLLVQFLWVRAAVSRSVYKLHESWSRFLFFFFFSFFLSFFFFLPFAKHITQRLHKSCMSKRKSLKKKEKKKVLLSTGHRTEKEGGGGQQLPSTFEFPGLSSYRTHVGTKVLPHQHPLKVKPLNERYIGSGCVR